MKLGYGRHAWWHGSHGHTTRFRVRPRPIEPREFPPLKPRKVIYPVVPMTAERRAEIYGKLTPRRRKRLRQKTRKHDG
jgi:hypothetical protein